MLTLLQHTIPVKQHPFASLKALLDEPFPQSPEAMWHLEQRLLQTSAQAADQILLVQLTRAHEDATLEAEQKGCYQATAPSANSTAPCPLLSHSSRAIIALICKT